MSLSPHRDDREHGKFRSTAGGPAIAVTNADGTPISAGGGGGTSMTDDSAFTPGGSSVTPVGYLADDAAPDPVDEGDVGAARMRGATRVPYAELVDASGTPIGVGGNPVVTRLQTPAVAGLASAAINASGAGDNALVAGVAGQTVRIWKIFLVCSAAVSLKFKDGAGADLTPALAMLANASIVLDVDGEPWFVTGAGNGFVLNLGSAVQVSGRVYYTQG